MVKNRLNRLLRPHMGVYFGIMGVFSGIAMLMEQYWMGAVMGGSAALLYVAYNLDRSYRRKQLLKYLEKEENAMESSGRGEAPFPAVMVRLGDGTIACSATNLYDCMVNAITFGIPERHNVRTS